MVPRLWKGQIDDLRVDTILDTLRSMGSYAAPGFMDPEGIVIFHTASNTAYKKTLENDGVPKSTLGGGP